MHEGGIFPFGQCRTLTFRLVLFAHGWALKHWYFRDIIALEGYIEEGLNLFLHALLTPSGWQHWHSLMAGEVGGFAPQQLVKPSPSLRNKTSRGVMA